MGWGRNYFFFVPGSDGLGLPVAVSTLLRSDFFVSEKRPVLESRPRLPFFPIAPSLTKRAAEILRTPTALPVALEARLYRAYFFGFLLVSTTAVRDP